MGAKCKTTKVTVPHDLCFSVRLGVRGYSMARGGESRAFGPWSCPEVGVGCLLSS